MLEQELSNPLVRPHLVFFPEDAPELYSDACHGQRWLRKMDAELLSPMISEKGQQFYIFEPTMLVNQVFCIPHRWFRRSGSMRGWAWRMIRLDSGWVVDKNDELDIAVAELATSLPYLLGTFQVRGFPDPRNIIGKETIYLSSCRWWTANL